MYRNPMTRRWTLPIAAVFLIVGSVVGGGAGYLWGAFAVTPLLAIWPSLIVTREGVVVRNYLHRHSLSWADIADVEVQPYHAGEWLTLQLQDGRQVRVWAVGPGPGWSGENWIEETTEAVARRWELATGRRSTESVARASASA